MANDKDKPKGDEKPTAEVLTDGPDTPGAETQDETQPEGDQGDESGEGGGILGPPK